MEDAGGQDGGMAMSWEGLKRGVHLGTESGGGGEGRAGCAKAGIRVAQKGSSLGRALSFAERGGRRATRPTRLPEAGTQRVESRGWPGARPGGSVSPTAIRGTRSLVLERRRCG